MSSLVKKIQALGEGDRLSVMTVFTTVKEDGGVLIESKVDVDFERELPHIDKRLKTLLKGAIIYAGYFKKVPVNEPIGFLDLHFFMDDVNPSEIRAGIYMEIQDDKFHTSVWPEFTKDVIAEAIIDVNMLNPLNFN